MENLLSVTCFQKLLSMLVYYEPWAPTNNARWDWSTQPKRAYQNYGSIFECIQHQFEKGVSSRSVQESLHGHSLFCNESETWNTPFNAERKAHICVAGLSVTYSHWSLMPPQTTWRFCDKCVKTLPPHTLSCTVCMSSKVDVWDLWSWA